MAASMILLLSLQASFPFEQEISLAIADVRDVYDVPPALVRAIIKNESGGNPRAVSPAGARGLMQVMPETARKVGVPPRQLGDPAENILAGVRLLAALLRHYDGDVIGVLVAYNARPRKLFEPIPRNGETPQYVRAVLADFARFSGGKVPVRPSAGTGRKAATAK